MLNKKIISTCLVMLMILIFANYSFGFNLKDPDLKYRTYDNSSYHQWRGWVATFDGEPIKDDIVSSIEVTVNDGTKIDIADIKYWSIPKFYKGEWNGDKVEYTGPCLYSGYIINFPDSQTFESGNYTYHIKTDQGKSDSQEIYFPGKEKLPTVNKESINYTWNSDGSLTLTWNNPQKTGFDNYMLYFLDAISDNERLFIRLPTDKTSITIPSSIINDIFKTSDSSTLQLHLQTIKISKDNMTYARGVTRKKIDVSGDGG